MAIRNGEDMSPAEVGLWLVEGVLNVVVGAPLVTSAATIVVWLWRRDLPVGLAVVTAVLMVSTATIHTHHQGLSRRLTYRSRPARPAEGWRVSWNTVLQGMG